MHFVYIVRCADGTFYTGYATEVEARVEAHNDGRGAKYTRGRRPVRLVYSEACGTKSEALRREHAIKRLPRAAKAALCGTVEATVPVTNCSVQRTIGDRHR